MPLPWMSRRDRRAWRSATTIADLAELTARWLEGDLASRPAYQPRYGPDEETTDLIPTLAACNRAGFLTDSSQPGYNGPGYDGTHWQQRAAVQGYIADLTLLERVRAAAADAGLCVIVHSPGAPAGWCVPSRICATRLEGQPHTSFGDEAPAHHIAATWMAISNTARRALTDAPQIAVIDYEWGRNDLLWPLLDKAVQ